MRLVEVTEIPVCQRKQQIWLRPIFEEFIAMNVRIARVELENEPYATSASAFNAFYKSARDCGFPVYVQMAKGDIYFVRKDM